MPTRSVFDLRLALSFSCLTVLCCCFITANRSITFMLFCYGYICFKVSLHVVLVTHRLAHAYLKIYSTPLDINNYYNVVLNSSMHENKTQVFLVNTTLDKTPMGKTSLECKSI
jgi:hypothetical protein